MGGSYPYQAVFDERCLNRLRRELVLARYGRPQRSPVYSRRVDEIDVRHLRRCLELARRAREDGNEPFGSLLVAVWLLGIIINLIVLGSFFDVALRDFGLLVGALALNRLALAQGQGR